METRRAGMRLAHIRDVDLRERSLDDALEVPEV
jgi:hypothetical protein